MRFEMDFYRAQRLWQPLLTTELRNTFVVGKWGERVRARLTKEQLKSLMRATHVSELDETAVVAYNGFDDLTVRYMKERERAVRICIRCVVFVLTNSYLVAPQCVVFYSTITRK